jgi:DNA polymerase V
MKIPRAQLIKKPENNHRVKRPTQTGFSSPATHYHEPRIDLNSVLVSNSESTFFIRVVDESFNDMEIHKNDVLIVDKSLIPNSNQLAVINSEGAFEIVRINDTSKDVDLWGVITYIIKSVL